PTLKEEENKTNNKEIIEEQGEIPKEKEKEYKNIFTEQELTKYKYILNNKEGDKLFFSSWEIIKMYACPSNCCHNRNSKFGVKLELYNKSKNIVDDYFEMTYIVRLLSQMEKLKYVMLTKEQLSLFKFISDVVCTINSTDESIPLNQLEMEFSDYSKMAARCLDYKNKIEERNRAATAVDIRLLELMDKRFTIRKEDV
ncbi:MAG: hypothetical protein MJ252_16455, partial [archaeon]|nr:hypothetical protein [archaeon]